jgi:hypothetical protein
MADHPVPASAVELTDEEIEARAKAMYALDQLIRAGLNKGREGLWEAAEAMYHFDEANGWSALDYESVKHYCADPEIGVSRATFYRMVRAYEQTVVRRNIPFARVKQLDRSKVDIVLGKVATGEVKIDKALDDAESLGARDLRDLYWGEQKSEPANDDDGVSTLRHDDEDDTGQLYGLDDEPLEDEGEDEVVSGTVVPDPDQPAGVAGEETDPHIIYGEVSLQQAREALESCRQALDSASDLLKRVALQKAITAFEAVLADAVS